MTITLQAVNELIASLESAGELSIKETKVMALAKAYQQLAAENVVLKSAIETHKHGFVRCNCCGDELMCHTDDVCRALDEIPATDRIMAGIKADGVEEWVSSRGGRWNGTTEEALKFAKQLREGAK